MAVTRPSVADISHFLSNLSGQKAWGVAWSIAGFTIEIGKERMEPERKRRCGEIGIFILCSWQLKTVDGQMLSEEDDHSHEEWTPLLRTHLENKIIQSASVNARNHQLLIFFKDGTELSVLPNPGKSEEVWTLFYFAQDGSQHWCTLNGKKVLYDD